VQYGPGGELIAEEASMKAAIEIDQSSMVSPPRDTDLTSQVESDLGGAA